MGYLIDLYGRQGAGWRIRNNDLTLDEWRVLARIREHYEDQREARFLSLGRKGGSE